jgi:2Fe-2S ferredoxin
VISLKGKFKQKQVEIETGFTILDMALKHDVDWGFSCTRGTCARCRCMVLEGSSHLNEPTDAEFERLGEEEIAQGYRLGCQAEIISEGELSIKLETYF